MLLSKFKVKKYKKKNYAILLFKKLQYDESSTITFANMAIQRLL